jgi:hypothetical protein
VEFVLIIGLLGLFDLLALRFGVDSTDGNNWMTHRPV